MHLIHVHVVLGDWGMVCTATLGKQKHYAVARYLSVVGNVHSVSQSRKIVNKLTINSYLTDKG